MRMQSEHLYAVYGGYKEKGNRPYWLVWCIKAPYEAPKGLKANDDSTIRKGTWIFDAYFFASTSEDQERRSYKLLSGLDQVVHLLVKNLLGLTARGGVVRKDEQVLRRRRPLAEFAIGCRQAHEEDEKTRENRG